MTSSRLIIMSHLGGRVVCEVITGVPTNGSVFHREFIVRCGEAVTHLSVDRQRNVYLEGGYTEYNSVGEWVRGRRYHAYVPPKRIGKLHEIAERS